MARPKGSPKVGGRVKGTPNRATVERQATIAASGLTPLDYMLKLMRDENEIPPVRLDAAKAAAPYVHPRLNAITLTGKDGGPVQVSSMSDEELMEFLQQGKG